MSDRWGRKERAKGRVRKTERWTVTGSPVSSQRPKLPLEPEANPVTPKAVEAAASSKYGTKTDEAPSGKRADETGGGSGFESPSLLTNWAAFEAAYYWGESDEGLQRLHEIIGENFTTGDRQLPDPAKYSQPQSLPEDFAGTGIDGAMFVGLQLRQTASRPCVGPARCDAHLEQSDQSRLCPPCLCRERLRDEGSVEEGE